VAIFVPFLTQSGVHLCDQRQKSILLKTISSYLSEIYFSDIIMYSMDNIEMRTSKIDIDIALATLQSRKNEWAKLNIRQRIRLVGEIVKK